MRGCFKGMLRKLREEGWHGGGDMLAAWLTGRLTERYQEASRFGEIALPSPHPHRYAAACTHTSQESSLNCWGHREKDTLENL